MKTNFIKIATAISVAVIMGGVAFTSVAQASGNGTQTQTKSQWAGENGDKDGDKDCTQIIDQDKDLIQLKDRIHLHTCA